MEAIQYASQLSSHQSNQLLQMRGSVDRKNRGGKRTRTNCRRTGERGDRQWKRKLKDWRYEKSDKVGW